MSKKTDKECTGRVVQIPGVEIHYTSDGEALEEKAKAAGWCCEWKSMGIHCPRPDYWKLAGHGTRMAFNNGGWFDPDFKLIARLKWGDDKPFR